MVAHANLISASVFPVNAFWLKNQANPEVYSGCIVSSISIHGKFHYTIKVLFSSYSLLRPSVLDDMLSLGVHMCVRISLHVYVCLWMFVFSCARECVFAAWMPCVRDQGEANEETDEGRYDAGALGERTLTMRSRGFQGRSYMARRQQWTGSGS